MSKTYVLAPNFSIAPPPPIKNSVPPSDKSRIQLGDILTRHFDPLLVALNRDAREAIEEQYLEEVDEKGAFTSMRGELLRGRFGLAARLFALLVIGVAVDVGLFMQRNSKEEPTITSLETLEFRVTDDYI